jgi:hypothetical protein
MLDDLKVVETGAYIKNDNANTKSFRGRYFLEINVIYSREELIYRRIQYKRIVHIRMSKERN